MAAKESEFLVDGWVMNASGQFQVIGCCGDVPIRLNDQFDVIFRYKKRRFPDELGDDPIREEEIPASIRVEHIHAYERSLGMLGQGMTGSIIVSGEGIEKIARGWVLGMKNGHAVADGPDGPSPNDTESPR